jgi:uncharacterized membrane protein YtjA (UPF0391 family)
MIYWFFAFLAVAIVATVLGFIGLPKESADLARQFALVTLAIALISYFGIRRRNVP